MLRMSKADEHGGEEGEHVGLYERHKNLDEIHEEEHEGAEGIEAEAHASSHGPTQEDDAREGEDDGVARHHVGKETDHEGERLREDADNLDDGNQRGRVGLEEEGNLGPEDLLPVFLVAKDVDKQHGADGKEEGDVDVARHISATREDGEKAEDVGGEDEEEHRKEVGGELLVVLLANACADDSVVDGHGEHLHHANESAGCLALLVALLVPTGTAEEDGEHNEHDNPNLHGALGEAEVEGAVGSAVGVLLVYLAVGFLVEEESFGQFLGGAEMPLAVLRATDDDGEGNAHGMFALAADVPFVGVGKVFKHNLRDVDCGFLFLLRFLCEDGHCNEGCNEKEEYGLDTFH